MGSVARNFNIGVELHQTGLNLLSAQMFKQFPQWFSKTQQIPIDPTSGRILVLAVDVTDPIAFTLSPIPGQPTAGSQILAQASVRFTLSDLPTGGVATPITAIRATVQAMASAAFANKLVSLSLNSFQVLNLTADAGMPAPVLTGRTLSVKDPLVKYAATTPAPTDDAFVAILNYLIAVFLQDGLEQPIAQFPVPQFQTLPVIQLPLFLRGLAIFANRLGFYLRHIDGALEQPTGPPPVAINPEPHVSIGVVLETIDDVLSRLLPLTIPVHYGDSTNFFEVLTGSSITVLDSSTVELKSPDKIQIDLQFQAQLNMCLNVDLGQYQIHLPISLPIGAPSHFVATWSGFAKQTTDGMVHIVLQPGADFLKTAQIVIVTDWRDIFKAAVLEWLKAHVSPVLVKIPGIGWVIAKAVEVVVPELAAAFGVIVDGLESSFLTLMANLTLQVLAIWFSDQLQFEVYKFNATLPVPGLDLKIASIGPIEVADNANGELVLHCWFDNQGLPVPAPPTPPVPPIPNEPPTPGSPLPPSYPPAEFEPALSLNSPQWPDRQQLIYDVILKQASSQTSFLRRISFAQLTGPDRWQSTVDLEDSQGNRLFQSVSLLDRASLRPLSETTWGKGVEGGPAVTSEVVFDYVGATAQVSARIDTNPSQTATVPLPTEANFVPSEDWMFELMTAKLKVGDRGKVARVELLPGTSSGAWAKIVPVNVTVAGSEQLPWQGNLVPTLKIVIQDDQTTSTVWVESSGSRRPLLCQQQFGSDQITMTLR